MSYFKIFKKICYFKLIHLLPKPKPELFWVDMSEKGTLIMCQQFFLNS